MGVGSHRLALGADMGGGEDCISENVDGVSEKLSPEIPSMVVLMGVGSHVLEPDKSAGGGEDCKAESGLRWTVCAQGCDPFGVSICEGGCPSQDVPKTDGCSLDEKLSPGMLSRAAQMRVGSHEVATGLKAGGGDDIPSESGLRWTVCVGCDPNGVSICEGGCPSQEVSKE